MGLKQAFNAITRIHSRAATLKRLGTPDIYSPIRITPSNYFRYLEGPSNTTIHGREFIIPIDSMKGQATQLITFSEEPSSGGFILTYDSNDTTAIMWDDAAADVEDALQLLTGLSGVTVTGDYDVGFTVTFGGVSVPSLLIASLDTPALSGSEEIDITISSDYAAWSPLLKRADKIIDSVYGSLALDEIIEMVDLGGSIMGYRVRCE